MNISNDYSIYNSIWKTLLSENKNIAAAKEESSAVLTVGEELAEARKYDRLELSAEYKTESSPNRENISESERIHKMIIVPSEAEERIGQMYKTGKGGLTEDDIAEVCGAIGREIDKAFSEGKISEEEMNSLNSELDEYTEYLSKESTFRAALYYTGEAINGMVNGIMNEYFEELYKAAVFGRGPVRGFPSKEQWGRIGQYFMNKFDFDQETIVEKIQKIREDDDPQEDYADKWKLDNTRDQESDGFELYFKKYMPLLRRTYDGLKEGKTLGEINDNARIKTIQM
ncbi:MAG: hypothetical protein K2K57_14970 [Oscillospiraceae bacterium]|nr:hypothetical protein [Oscillospiraceae bacterium]